MREKKEKTQRVTLRVVKTTDGYYVIQKHQTGFDWTTYPFRYAREPEARHDFNVIMKCLIIRGFSVVEEEEVKAEQQA